MKLTREQAIAKHRKLWNWIADETIRTKTPTPKYAYFISKLRIYNVPMNCCYCCEYTIKILKATCKDCPINWEYGDCTLSEYEKWSEAYNNNDYELAAKYARIIANLPERLDNKK